MTAESHTTPLRVTGPSPVGARIVDGDFAAGAAERDRARERAATEALESAAGVLEKVGESLEATRQEALDEVAETAVRLALDIVEELLRTELIAGNYDIAAITREALAAACNAPGVTTIHVNPADAEALSRVSFRTGTEVEADPSIRRGDVHVHTSQGLLVREIDACAQSIRERLLAEVESC